jgi:hypothetical protein
MNKQAERIEEDFELEAEAPEELEAEVEDVSEAYVDGDADDEADGEAEPEEEEVVISIDGEAPPQQEEEEARAPEWVRDLRKQHREEKRRVKELQQRLAQYEQKETGVAPLGKKPTLESVDYDTERYETELASWYEKKRAHDEREAAVKAEQQSVQQEWEQKLETYQEAKTSLKVRDFEFAEEVVQDTLSVMQQGMIVQGSENPALLVYALGKNPNKAKELASINDPVKFAFAVAKLETQLKISNRKASVSPERKISGTGRPSGTVDNTLDRLRAEAEKTGDYTKVIKYKRQKQKA